MPKYNDFDLDVQDVKVTKIIDEKRTTYYTRTQCHCTGTSQSCDFYCEIIVKA